MTDPNVLVGLDRPDDAAVVRLLPELALVFTTDFFTPIVDDPHDFGRIAAANALSDVYAMGATPLVALNVAAFPTRTLPLSILGEILAGGAEVAREAGIVIAGGHTIDDPEPKYGLAAIGTVHPDRIWRKGGARAGDALVLTKALGTGILATALKRDLLAESHPAIEAMVSSMTTLNARAAELARAQGPAIHAATDVTGYGLVGHLLELLRASGGIGAVLSARALPLLPSARDLARDGILSSGSRANREHADEAFRTGSGVSDELAWLACDAQTSGGLLLAMPEEVAHILVATMKLEPKLAAARIVGHVTDMASPIVVLEP